MSNYIKVAIMLIVLAIFWVTPAPLDMPVVAWRFFGVFIAMIIGLILEPLPATAISLIAIVLVVVLNSFLLFGPEELAKFKSDSAASKAALAWGLKGFSSSTVWLVFGAFMFALGYKVSGLGKRIALIIVKLMGKSTLTLGYAIVIIDCILAPCIPSNTARTGGTIFPVIRNLPPIFDSQPNDPVSSRKIGSYLMWMMIISTSVSSSMFITGAAPNALLIGFAHEYIEITWAKWFFGFLPGAIILIIIAPLISYFLYKPTITKNSEVTKWAAQELSTLGKLSYKELALIALIIISLTLWIFGKQIGINSTVTALIAVSFMLILRVVVWKDIISYAESWNTLVNLATLVTMANGLEKTGFIKWFSGFMSHHLGGFDPVMAILVMILIFYFSHYFFASFTAHTTTLVPMILAVGLSIPGVHMAELCLLLGFTIGLMGVLTPYATGPNIIVYGSGYMQSKDFWRMGFTVGIVFMAVLLGVVWPILRFVGI